MENNMDTVIMNSGWIYRPAPLPEIWECKYGKWYSRCPICQSSRSHKSRVLAIDKGHDPCRKCKIERGLVIENNNVFYPRRLQPPDPEREAQLQTASHQFNQEFDEAVKKMCME